jgi:hypothetical protein
MAPSTPWLILLAAGCMVLGAAAQEPAEPKELQEIRAEYNQRAQFALDPVKNWYRQQLEILKKVAVARNDLDTALALSKEEEA